MSIKLDLALIRIDGGTQIRDKNDDDAINDYAQRTAAGEVAPPVDVFYDGVAYWLANGFHRYHAARACGHVEISATVHTGTKDDAVLFACGANADHGVKRTAQDKRNAVEQALRVFEGRGIKQSDGDIAMVCRVSRKFVNELKGHLVTGYKMDLPTTNEVTRGGKTFTQDTSKIGKSRKPSESSRTQKFAEDHAKVRELAAAGYTTSDIVEQTGIPKRFVMHAKEEIRETRSVLANAIQDAEVTFETWESRLNDFDERWGLAAASEKEALIAALQSCCLVASKLISRLKKNVNRSAK